MIVNAKEILLKAKKEKYAVPHFNINNLEWIRYILEECEKNNSPVILGVSEGAAKYMGGYVVVASLVKNLHNALNITVPVAIHLDHGSSPEECVKAIVAGFTSVMYDGSKETLEENIKKTKEVVDFAKKFDVSVEAELGHIGGVEDGITDQIAYAKLDDCIKLCKKTNVDFLAPAIGSSHGIYEGIPKLKFELMKQISEEVDLPLVLHGGSGIPDDLIKKSIECGISKINVNTELQISWSNQVRKYLSECNVYDPRKIIKSGESDMKNTIREKIILFNSENKA